MNEFKTGDLVVALKDTVDYGTGRLYKDKVYRIESLVRINDSLEWIRVCYDGVHVNGWKPRFFKLVPQTPIEKEIRSLDMFESNRFKP